MTVARPFGPPGGARGIDHVGQLFRQAWQCRVGIAVTFQPVTFLVQAQGLNGLAQRQVVQQVALGQQQAHATVFDHVAQAFAGVFRIERHVGTTGLENREQRHDHFHRTLGSHAHQQLGTSRCRFAQLVRQTVGALIELLIRQGLLVEQQGNRLWIALHLLLEQLMHTALRRELRLGTVPVQDLGLHLGGIKYRQFTDPPRAVGDDLVEHLEPMARHALDSRLNEQITGKGQGSLECAAFFVGIQGQVELGGATVPFKPAQAEPGAQLQRLDVSHFRLMVVHHLEQRGVAQATLQLEGIDQALKWQVLMGLRGIDHFLEVLQ
ncbi:hypothetical protein [Pseudomonas sp. 25 R 14]|nr:hypothetical protein [Pseudomonas sp. 25 R 14]